MIIISCRHLSKIFKINIGLKIMLESIGSSAEAKKLKIQKMVTFLIGKKILKI
jgi:hypothetical protein